MNGKQDRVKGITFGVLQQLAAILTYSLRTAKERIVQLIQMTNQPKFESSETNVWMLGVNYNLVGKSPLEEKSSKADVTQLTDQSREFEHDMFSRFWLTYRRNFVPIRDSSLTSDTGWGCMLRSGQMMIAQALVHHTLGRGWRLSSADHLPPAYYARIIDLFRDHPTAPFSVHKVAEAGEQVGGRRVGQWLGPCTVCAALAHLWRGLEGGACLGLRALLLDSSAGDNTIYTGLVRPQLATGPLLLLLPVRLGAHTIDASYIPQVVSACPWFYRIASRPAGPHGRR